MLSGEGSFGASVSRIPTAVLQLNAGPALTQRADEAEEAALKGDRAAWSELIMRHERRVVLSVIAAGIPPAQAREFAHDAWLRLMQQAAAGKLEFIQLPGLVVRQALFLARTAARRPATLPEEEAHQDSGEAQYFAREKLERAREKIEALPESSRRVFLTLYSEPGLSHAEVAARVGLSVQRVRQILCEVRKTLRADLEQETTHVAHRP